MSLSMSSSPSHRRRKHSRNKNTRKMAISDGNDEPTSPSSPFCWRLRKEEKESSITSSKKGNKKSHGLPPSQFHAKQLISSAKMNTYSSNDKIKDNDGRTDCTTPTLLAWKEQAERNVLIQEHKNHANKLETKRKEFRRITQLKTWPLQDMA